MTVRSVYWAGDLFDHKDLIGNLLLAEAFDEAAAGRWKAVLPQKSEANGSRDCSIRDSDLQMLFQADAIVANFDGHDLDSGTVVEFCFAKMLDLPAVLLRTDFRDSNDRSTCPDPWNLMCSGYPRTASLLRPSMLEFHHCFTGGQAPVEGIRMYCRSLAESILKTLDQQTALPAFSGDDPEKIFIQYQLAVRSAGGKMPEIFPEETLKQLVADKIRRNIYH